MTRIDRIVACALAAFMIAVLPVAMLTIPTQAHARAACVAEDSPTWDWTRCGNREWGVVTKHGTTRVVTCKGLRLLIRHGDLDRHTPWLRGDRKCGRR